MLHPERFAALGRSLLVVMAATLLGSSLARPAHAEETRAAASLPLIPASASFYNAMLRNREQVEAAARSKAWARIAQLPLCRQAVKRLRQEYEDDEGRLAFLRTWMEQQENRDLAALLGDALSEEIFFYGGDHWVGFLDLMSQLQLANRLEQLRHAASGAGGKPDPQAQLRTYLRVLAESRDRLQVPELVIGFKIKDARQAEAQVKRLEALLTALLGQQPLLQGRLARAKIGGGSFLTLKLDGEMVPWGSFPWKQIEEKEDEFKDLRKSLRELRLTICLGVRDGFLLFAIGGGNNGLQQLGGKGPRLVSRPELKPLLQAGDRRFTDIGYSSKAMHSQGQMTRDDVEGLGEAARQVLEAAEVPADRRKAIEKDVAQLIKELQPHWPSLGAQVSFTFLSERGTESYTYEHGDFPEHEGSRPLSLLEHLGGDPILALVGRSRGQVEGYRRLAKWVRTFYGHAEPLIRDKLDDEQKEKYDRVRKIALPLLASFDEVTGAMLMPALADGEAGLVVDARWKSKRWHPSLELGEKALPMPEVGLVFGVSDAALLEKAMASYRKILNDALAAASESSKDGPRLRIPRPEVRSIRSGNLYVFTLPAGWEVDAQVAPTGGLSSRVAVAALSAGHAERLLTPRPLAVEGGPLANASRPLAGASYFRCPALIDALTPWAMLAAERCQEKLTELVGSEDNDKKGSEDLAGQVRTLLGAFKVFDTAVSTTRVEDGVIITHSETVLRDR